MAVNALDEERGYYRGLSLEELRRIMAIVRTHKPRSKDREDALKAAAIEYRKTYSSLTNIIGIINNWEREKEHERGAFNRLTPDELRYIRGEQSSPLPAPKPKPEPEPEPEPELMPKQPVYFGNITIALLTKMVEMQREQINELKKHTELLEQLSQKWS